MAAAAGVAFGGDQHVLAERGQLMAAERAAIRRGLAIRRAAHRPPRGRRKTRGHGPIVAPLGTALVVVGVGVALALAKAQRERRSAAERAKLAKRTRRDRRRPSLRAGEPLAEGLRRVILGQLDLAIELLAHYPAERVAQSAKGRGAEPLFPDHAGEDTVHEIRKAIKRLRALLALMRGELGPKRYARENTALRDCARRLACARDAEVMLDTLDAILERHPSRLALSAAVAALRAQLLAEREAAGALAVRDPSVRGEVLGELHTVRARVERWELHERPLKLLAPGLERIYRRGRLGLGVAFPRGKRGRRAGAAERTEALHAWRKRVKELRYAAETLDRGGKSSKRTRRLARRADRLGELLGEEHDLALLEGRVRERSRQFAGERRTRKQLLKLIARRRGSLRKRALREGERLYRRRPKRFVRSLKRTW